MIKGTIGGADPISHNITSWAQRRRKYLILPTPRLIGREIALQALRSHLDRNVLITSDNGYTGIGTTTLARALADAVADSFPDGCIELDLRGDLTHPDHLTPDQVQRRVLNIMTPRTLPPEDPELLRERYYAILKERRILLLLDNAATAGQVRRILPRDALARAIVTSQADLSSNVPGLYVLRLSGLDIEGSHRLIEQFVPNPSAHSRRYIDRIIKQLQGIPLALRMIAPLLAPQSTLTPRKVIHELENARRRLLALRNAYVPTAPADVALEAAYGHIADDLKPHFAALAVFPAPFKIDAAAAVWDTSHETTVSLLRHFEDLGLISHPKSTDYYEVHSVTRLFAQELLLGQQTYAKTLVTRYTKFFLKEVIRACLASPTPNAPRLDHYILWEHLPLAWLYANGNAPGWPKPATPERWIRDLGSHCQALLAMLLSPSELRQWLDTATHAAEALDDTQMREPSNNIQT